MGITTVNEYVNSLHEKGNKSVCEFVDFMRVEFPQITPKISYGMPMWRAGKKMYDGYVAVSAAKAHYSIHFHDEERVSHLATLLPDSTFGKKCVNIKYGDEKSAKLVMQIVKDYFNGIL
ncbi:DUF1801 domain-containing protein [Paenibacillus thiaminolyticus]|uniref:DUF1801 domain-containing protein n=1 Tax=Paenibacillus thiaminolyticus TaxID=49283 RepID=UPI00232C849F|nr:DUF1801 domain-containing protein [Paenibacillus thiaminolyticus]WCF10850.1 DUF1801 domain-containing protein [Paenibacillus thiaminolyticus]